MKIENLSEMQFKLLQAVCGEACPVATFFHRFAMQFTTDDLVPDFTKSRCEAGKELCEMGILEKCQPGNSVCATELGLKIWENYSKRRWF
jgi:hypothetical protein